MLHCTPGKCEPTDGGVQEYRTGLAAYTAHSYRQAAIHFWASINQGNKSAIVWLYLANSEVGAGKPEDAIKHYQSLIEIFEGTPEAETAAKCLKTLEASVAKKPAEQSKTSSTTVKSSSAGTPSNKQLKERGTIMPPANGHPAVKSNNH